MSVRYALCCLILALQSAAVAAEENYTISRVYFLPPVYYVGDEVEARIRLSVNDGLFPAEPSELPAPEHVHIRDVRIIPIAGEYDIRISFSTYKTGSGELPPLELGDITLSGVQIGAASILGEDDTTIVEAFGPVLLPGTRLLLALAVGGMLIVPPLIVFAVLWLRRFVKHLLAALDERRPYRELKLELEKLQDPSHADSSRDFYIKLTAIFRKYLSRRLDVELAAHTASELAADLAEKLKGVLPVENIRADLSRFDEVKFGGRGMKGRTRQRDIEKVRNVAAAIEEWKTEVTGHVDP